MYGSIFIQFCAVASKRRIFSAPECVLAVQGRSGSSKVDDFGTNRKRVCHFLLVRHCDYGPILHRFWDTATYWLKIAYFSYPSLIRRPPSCSLWNFAVKLSMRKLESWGYPPVKTPWSYSLSRFDSVPACVRQTRCNQVRPRATRTHCGRIIWMWYDGSVHHRQSSQRVAKETSSLYDCRKRTIWT